MKTLFLAVVLISGFQILAKTPVPFVGQEQGPNVPNIGSSLFDKIFSKLDESGISQYRIPFPISQLSEVEGLEGSNFVHSMFPLSRSLQRPLSEKEDPLTNPRLVLTTKGGAMSIADGKLFIGYVKSKDQLEVISFNDEAGRFEFQLVKNYSQQPEVYYVDRGKCLSCHQNQAGIFSPPAWEDSSFGPMKLLLFENLNLEGSERSKRRQLVRGLFDGLESNDEIAVLDSLIRDSDRLAMDERVWVHGCGEDTRCRLGILIASLSPNAEGANAYRSYAYNVISMSDLKRLGMTFSSFLTSHDIGVRNVITKFGSVRAVVESPRAISELVGNIYRLAETDNPATPRATQLRDRDLPIRATTFNRKDQITLAQEFSSQNQIFSSLVNLHSSGHEIFQKNAINKLKIMQTLLSEVNSKKRHHYRYWLTKPTPEKQFLDSGTNPVFQRRELNLFSRHCQKCHATNLKFPPQFLIGSEQEVLDQFKGLKTKLKFKLKNRLMPPSPEDRKAMRDSGDYQIMIDFVKSL